MSAIYGIIDFNLENIDKNLNSTMVKPYLKYKIDRYTYLCNQNILMNCSHQYITKESYNEILPFYDEKRNLYLTADCLIDNRQELIEELNLDFDVTDSTIIYQAYLQWKKTCVDHLLGNFTFVIYEKEANQAYLFADHIASRCLFYYFKDCKLYFSTLLTPILEVFNYQIGKNERWILDCASTLAPVMYTEPEETAFQGIKKLKAGTYLSANCKGTKVTEYYNPLLTYREWKGVSDEEYKQAFLNLMNTVTESSIRTDGEVGILLSSGLDSSAIACTGAPLLKKHGKSLYSYTSIPERDFVNTLPKQYIVDETEGVREICNKFSNIIPYFEACEGKNIITESSELVDILELPSKSQNNAVWLKEIAAKANHDNCKVLLDGQTGNTTVSCGDMQEYLCELLKHGKLINMYQESLLFTKNYKISRKRFLKCFIKSCLSSWHNRHIAIRYKTIYPNICINKDYAEKYNLNKRLKKKYHNIDFSCISSLKEIKSFMYIPLVLSQVNEIKTKIGLKYGIILRDPFADKRMIEFCLRLPLKCFVSDGIERRLIRKYYRNIIPNRLLSEIKSRGLQSADNENRINKMWPSIRKSFYLQISGSLMEKYIDKEKLNAYFQEIDHNISSNNERQLRHLVNLYMLSLFLERYSKP